MPNFIPRSDSGCLAWSAGYVLRVVANPACFSISDDDAAELAVLQANFAENLYLATARGTRSATATMEKNAARLAMEQKVRSLTNRPQTLKQLDRRMVIELNPRIGKRRRGHPRAEGNTFIHSDASLNRIAA